MLDIRDTEEGSGGQWKEKLFNVLTPTERQYIQQANEHSTLTPSIKETLLTIYSAGLVRLRVCTTEQSRAYTKLIFPLYNDDTKNINEGKIDDKALYHTFLKLKESLSQAIAERKALVQKQEQLILERIKKDFENIKHNEV